MNCADRMGERPVILSEAKDLSRRAQILRFAQDDIPDGGRQYSSGWRHSRYSLAGLVGANMSRASEAMPQASRA